MQPEKKSNLISKWQRGEGLKKKKNREKVDELRKMFGQMGAVAGEQVG